MKKIVLTLVAAVVAVCASAQVYVGGNVGIASVKVGDADAETSYKFIPEIGYQFSNDWAIGIVFGWGKGNPVTVENVNASANTFELNPYARYTFLRSKMVSAFMDGSVGYKHYSNYGDEYAFGIKPGVSLDFNRNFSLVAHVGFLGYKNYKPDFGSSSNAWGVDLDTNNITLGAILKF